MSLLLAAAGAPPQPAIVECWWETVEEDEYEDGYFWSVFLGADTDPVLGWFEVEDSDDDVVELWHMSEVIISDVVVVPAGWYDLSDIDDDGEDYTSVGVGEVSVVAAGDQRTGPFLIHNIGRLMVR